MDRIGKIDSLDWSEIGNELLERGYSVIDGLCDRYECQQLLDCYSQDELFRKTVNMSRHNFGSGEYKYFSYPLPPTVQLLRECFYKPLAAIANDWSSLLKDDDRWPLEHHEFLTQCNSKGQLKPTPLMLKYSKGDYNRLHQDMYGEVYFPFQLIILLNEPEADFRGGELILVENYPRMQSRPHLPKLSKGSAVIVPTQARPIPGAKGWRKAKMRHGVTEIIGGERTTLGVIFHDA